MAKKKRKAVRNPITGKVDHYTNTKTMGIRHPVTGKIVKRIKKKKASF
jgi:hypothetical protein